MVTCFGCGGLIDVHDRFCRWCGGTIIPDDCETGRPYAIVVHARETAHSASKNELCSHCHDGAQPPQPVNHGIGEALTQGIFRDDEHELNSISELMSR